MSASSERRLPCSRQLESLLRERDARVRAASARRAGTCPSRRGARSSCAAAVVGPSMCQRPLERPLPAPRRALRTCARRPRAARPRRGRARRRPPRRIAIARSASATISLDALLRVRDEPGVRAAEPRAPLDGRGARSQRRPPMPRRRPRRPSCALPFPPATHRSAAVARAARRRRRRQQLARPREEVDRGGVLARARRAPAGGAELARRPCGERPRVARRRARARCGSRRPARGGSRGSPRARSARSGWCCSSQSANRSCSPARLSFVSDSYAASRIRHVTERESLLARRASSAPAGSTPCAPARPASRRSRRCVRQARATDGSRQNSWPTTDAAPTTVQLRAAAAGRGAPRAAPGSSAAPTTASRRRLARAKAPASARRTAGFPPRARSTAARTSAAIASAASEPARSARPVVARRAARARSRCAPIVPAQSGRARASSSRARQRSISGRVGHRCRQVLDQVEQRRLRPVDVLENEHQRAAFARAPRRSAGPPTSSPSRSRRPPRGRRPA